MGLGAGVLSVVCTMDGLDPAAALAWAAVPVYVLHQVEEWGIDFKGQPHAFYDLFLSRTGLKSSRLLLAVGVNIGSVWVAGVAGAMQGTPAAALPLLGTIAVNALVHVAAFVKDGAVYHAGIVTAVLLFIPFTVSQGLGVLVSLL